jgi:copper chaperone CopZ
MSVPLSNPESSAAVTEFSVIGMNCEHCAKLVSNAIGAVAGVIEVNVSLPSNSASVRWSAVPPNIEAVVEAVKKAGYKAQKK